MAQTAKDIVKYYKDKELPPLGEICVIAADYPVSPERRRLLSALSLPQSATMAVKDICTYANIHPNTYYTAIKDPEFQALQTKLTRSLISGKALKHFHKYDEIAMKGDRQALERLMSQQGTLDPEQRNVNVQSLTVNAGIGELVALIKEQQIDDPEIADLVEVIQEEMDNTPTKPGANTVPNSPLNATTEPQRDDQGQCDTMDTEQGERATDNEPASLEGSTPDEGEVPGIPQENIGPSLSEKNNNSEATNED